MTWITPSSTGAEDWRKRGQRIARQSLVEAYPDGPPLGLTFQQMVDGARRLCRDKGWLQPSDRTYQRAINGT
jgi:hypothetical protein